LVVGTKVFLRALMRNLLGIFVRFFRRFALYRRAERFVMGFRRAVHLLSSDVTKKKIEEISGVNRAVQNLLTLHYKNLENKHHRLPSFEEIEFRAYSQNGEDGVIHYIFSLIGMRTKRGVEIGCGDGIECNLANLLINHGWYGLLIDADARKIRKGRKFYSECRDIPVYRRPTMVDHWVTVEKVNQILSSNGFQGEIDLLSIDIDGVDFWIWKAIECIRPRVVVVEYLNLLGPELSLTVPYRSDFKSNFVFFSSMPPFLGASLAAYVKLGRKKGFRLIGCESSGANAFFMREDVGAELFPEVSPSQCLLQAAGEESYLERFPEILELEWASV